MLFCTHIFKRYFVVIGRASVNSDKAKSSRKISQDQPYPNKSENDTENDTGIIELML